MTLATGGDSVDDIEVGDKTYRIHQFTSPTVAVFNESAAKLQSDTNEVDGHTIVAGDVVYVEDSSDEDQIGNTYKASGSTDNWTWTLYGLTVSAAGDVEYAIGAAGGRGGGGDSFRHGGGGGAGGFHKYVAGESGNSQESPMGLLSQFYPIRIGKAAEIHDRGGNTLFAALDMIGGGRGGRGSSTASVRVPQTGGSGGGAGGGAVTGQKTDGAAGTSEQGNAGGTSFGVGSGQRASGGGGGAGGDGGDNTENVGGVSGIGIESSITGHVVTYCIGGPGSGDSSFSTPDNPGSGGAGARSADEGQLAKHGFLIVRYELTAAGNLLAIMLNSNQYNGGTAL
jgi:hypothetical protein